MLAGDDVLELCIKLDPVPAARPRAVRGRGAYYPPRYAAWREAADVELARELDGLLGVGDSPVEVEFEFVCKRPKRPAKPWPQGDVDNYAKAALDALTKAGVWDDDTQVIRSSEFKRYALAGEEPRTQVRIKPLDM